MSYLIRSFLSLFQLLHSQNGEKSISIGVCFGCILGFSPLLSPQSILLLFCSLVFRVQIGAMLLSWLGFSLLSLGLAAVCEPLGYYLLSNSVLSLLWAPFFNIPGSHFTQLNNSLVLGNYIFALLISPLVYYGTIRLILRYRKSIGARINQSKFIKLIKASKLYSLYDSYARL